MRGCEVARFEVRGCEVRGSRLRGCEVRGSRLRGSRFKIFHIPSDDIFLDSFVFTNGEVRGSRFEVAMFEVASFSSVLQRLNHTLMIKLPGFYTVKLQFSGLQK